MMAGYILAIRVDFSNAFNGKTRFKTDKGELINHIVAYSLTIIYIVKWVKPMARPNSPTLGACVFVQTESNPLVLPLSCPT